MVANTACTYFSTSSSIYQFANIGKDTVQIVFSNQGTGCLYMKYKVYVYLTQWLCHMFYAFALSGRRDIIRNTPRALPWAMSLLGFQPVLLAYGLPVVCLWLARIVCQWLSARMFVFLLHEYHEILAGRPEYLRVVDAQHILLVGILLQGVRTWRMHGENACRLRVELYLLVDTDVDLGEVVLVEVRLKHLWSFEDVLFLQLLLGSEYKPCGVELLVLSVDSLALLRRLCLEARHVVVESVDSLVEFGNVYVLGIEFGTQLLELVVLLVNLLYEVLNGLA